MKIILVINLLKEIVYYSFDVNFKIIRFFCRTLYFNHSIHGDAVPSSACWTSVPLLYSFFWVILRRLEFYVPTFGNRVLRNVST